MATGYRDLSTLVMLTGWDATELQKFQLKDGTSYAQIVAEINAALNALNAEINSDPLWAGLMSFTDQPEVEYRVGASNGFEDHTEYGRPDPKRAGTEGHMLPLRKFDRALGWTWDYLKEARLAQIQADIADAIKDARDLVRIRILTRLLKRTDDSGAANGLGASGLSPGFATAAASTGVDFTPIPFGGSSFDSNHEHYVGITGGAVTNAVFEDVFDELREHGHEAPFTFLISPSHRLEFLALSATTRAAQMGVRVGSTQDIANPGVTVPGSPWAVFLGVNNEIEVYEVRGIPQYYGVGYKTYGPRSQRNPLRARLEKGKTAPAIMAMTDPRAGSGAYPLQYLMLYTELGIGVGADRTVATPRYFNSATWANGTPT